MTQLKVNITDGGRSKYFKKEQVGDCVTRAIAIATERDYKEGYNEIAKLIGYTPRNGVKSKDTKRVMKHFGGSWNACMGVGTGCRIHLSNEWSDEGYNGIHELPKHSRIICNLSGHVCAVINGVIHDTYDPSRNGTRCVYGFWYFSKQKPKEEEEKPVEGIYYILRKRINGNIDGKWYDVGRYSLLTRAKKGLCWQTKYGETGWEYKISKVQITELGDCE